MAEGRTRLARHTGRWPLLLAAAALFGVAAALVAVVHWDGLLVPPAPSGVQSGIEAGAVSGAATKAQLAARPTPPFVRAPGSTPAAPERPSFDVVRIDREGRSVMAGRAPAGSQVTVMIEGPKGNVVVGKTESDSEGQWVLVPDRTLPAGTGTLTLSARLPNGNNLASPEQVVAVVPRHPGTVPPVALLSGAGAVPRLIEAPPAAAGASPVGLDLLQYGQHDRLLLAGRAPPDADIRVYLDDRAVGDATADASGHWALSMERGVAAGSHRIRLDQIAADGKVMARILVPFARPALAAAAVPAAGRTVVVRPGQCLWVIAEHAYGSGSRYTLVFQANRGQIRNPDLIYPGQVFTLPALPAQGGGRF